MPKRKSKPKEAGAPAQPIHLPALDNLTLKEQMFVQAIATPGSDTFGNGAQSAVAAGYAINGDKGRRIATALRSKIDVSTAIDETFRKANLGIEVRAAALKDILSNPTTDVQYLNKSGEIVQTTRTTNAKHIIGAISLLNKMDGTYARSEAIGKAQGKLLEPILEDYTRRLRAELRDAPQMSTPMDESQTTIEAEIVDEQLGDSTQAEAGKDTQDTTAQGDAQ